MKVRKILSAILAMTMVLSTFSFTVFSEDEGVAVVAKINDAEYSSLEAAIDAADAADVIEVVAEAIDLPVITKAGLTFKTTVGTKVSEVPSTNSDFGWNIEGSTFDGFEFTSSTSFVGKDLTFKNCNFTGSNGIYYGVASGEWLIEGCVFNNEVYGLQFGSDSKGTVNVKNCTFYGGFNTYGSTIDICFTGCTFTKGKNYDVLQTTGKMTLKDCIIDASWPNGANGGHIGNNGANGVTELYNTTYGNGTLFELMEDKTVGTFAVNPTKNDDGFYTGGIFNNAPEADKIAEGYKAYEDPKGCFEIKEQFDAEVNGVKYKTLQEAVTAAQEGDTVRLANDVMIDKTLEIAADKNITLDLAGNAITVTKSGDRSLYAFVNYGNLVLEDSVGGGSITARGTDNYGTFTMNSGTIIACDTNGGYGVWNRDGAVFTMNGGSVEATHYGAYSDQYGPTCLGNMAGATMTINQGTIKSNSMRAYALASEGTLTINNANVTGYRGVAVNNGTAVINDGTITALDATTISDAPESYYALYLEAEGVVTVNGGTFNAANYFVNILGSVDIKDGYFNAGIGSNEDIYTGTINISGGYFAADVSEYLAESKRLAVSDLKAYAYMVSEKSANTIDSKVEATASKKNDAVTDESFGTTNVTASGVVAAITSKDTENTSALVGAANTVEIESTPELDAEISNAATALGVTPENVQLVKKPYLEIVDAEVSENTEDSSKDDTLKYTVKAMYQTVATKEGSEQEEPIGEPEILEVIQSVAMSLPVPAGVVSDNKVIVKHTKDDGTVFYYEAAVDAYSIATFTNPNGFSTFEILPLTDVSVVAKVGDSGFATLQEAVEYIDNGGTVTVVSGNSHTINLTDSKTFTLENVTGDVVTVTVNGTEYTIADTESEEIVYTKSVTDGTNGSNGGGGSSTLYTVDFDSNGGSKISSIKARRGQSIDEPTAPTKDGYTFVGWYKDSDLTDKFDFESTVIIKDITLYAKWIKDGEEEAEKPEDETAPVVPQDTFADVAEDAWYFDAVKYVKDNKLMNGVAENKFAPDAPLTRAMLVTILYRNEGEPEMSDDMVFEDVGVYMYHAKAVAWAKANEIVNGVTDTQFAPDLSISREQIATIIFRYAQHIGMEAVTLEENLTAFSDSDKISEYAVFALNWAVGKGIINGKGNNLLDPQGEATRAEIATILQRFIEMNK